MFAPKGANSDCQKTFWEVRRAVAPPSCIPNPATCAVDSEGLRSKVSLHVSLAAPQAPEGSVSPVDSCAKRKATRRRAQIQGLRAASAQNADICEQGKRVLAEKAAVDGLFRHAVPAEVPPAHRVI